MRAPVRFPRRRRRGNALVEFAIGFGFLLSAFAGVYQFGYAFYLYNNLESAVRDGARYASQANYDAPQATDFRTRVRNMVVYGHPSPPTNTRPVVPRLLPANITVTPNTDAVGVPRTITVQVNGYVIDSIFATYTLAGRPRCTFDFLGLYVTP